MDESEPTFEIVSDQAPGSTVLAGFSEFGLAGLTAVDYLVDQLSFEQRGHVRSHGVPTLTPFENGEPRHHSRLFESDDYDLTVLVGEVFVPATLADRLGESVYQWAEGDAEEIVLLSGVPFTHGPDDHRPFYIATEGYRQRRLAETDLTPMGRGFLDGVNGSFMACGLERGIDTGLFTTPTHPRTPDIEAALRLLDAIERVYGLGVDTGPLESFADEIEQHYRELANRIEEASDEIVPEDRMYM